jgi:CcmD family protein
MKSYSFLFWAYNVVWLGIAAYVVFLLLRLGKLSSRLDRLERRLDRASEKP